MIPLELKLARVRREQHHRAVAESIGKSLDSYSKKERGLVSISLEEALSITQFLGLTFDEFNIIFFDGNLPFRKISSTS